MIFLPTDECAYFDFFAILAIKIQKCSEDKRDYLLSQYEFYENNLKEQVGDDLVDKILKSREYRQLSAINSDLFDLINHCKKYSVEFRVADQMNFKRSEFKNNLQKKFFGKPAAELKLGYSEKKSK